MAATASAVQQHKVRSSRSFSFRQSFYGGPKPATEQPKSSSPQPPTKTEAPSPKQHIPAPIPQLPSLQLSTSPIESTLGSYITYTESDSDLSQTRKSTVDSSVTSNNVSLGSTDFLSKVPTVSTIELSPVPLSSTLQAPEVVLSDGAANQPQITISTFLKPSEVMNDTSYQRSGLERSDSVLSKSEAEIKSTFIADSFASLSRRQWNSPAVSRSPSPSSRDDRSSRDEDDSTTASSVSSTSPTKLKGSAMVTDVNNGTPPRPRLPHSASTSKKSRRPLSMFMRNSSYDVSALPSDSSESVTIDRSASTPNVTTYKKVKDELWEAYKLLENDYQKFQGKSNMHNKTSIVRQSLLPFLRKFKEKSSKNVSPEELEKRTRTLHRWWTGLLAQLRSRATQGISGADKPVYLEAISYIMSRPEWRSPPSTFAPLGEKLPLAMKSASSSSLSSASSSYSIQKSVQHNIKVLFTRTLYDTLAFVVEKMAMRTAPPSMVAFGGKVIAYAWFFCAGVADMLISLWGLQPSSIRKVLPEFGVGRGTDLQGVSETVGCEFPETIQHLGFTTLVSMIRQLKKPAKAPLGVQVDWHGPWTSRWTGRDSDLLFVFFKYFHSLLFDYLPADASPTARLAAPGYVPVLAQILDLIEGTIHRQLGNGAPENTASTTFEDLLNSTASIPLPIRNGPRTMAENKLVVLLRDMLFDENTSAECRDAYVSSFAYMFRAVVRGTQLYDADACFQLCDFMEELLPILAQAAKAGRGDYIDWKFWIDVAKTMLQSENNMTELRVLALIYTTWDILIEDPERKRVIVLDWLLSAPLWDRFFCHWCPMVRAYHMRLACWRIGRYDGGASELDVEIYRTMLVRLRTGYAHHTQLKENGKTSSTAPCLPAPSRRLVIIRNDTIISPQGVLLDGIIPTSFGTTPSLMRSNSSASLASLVESDARSVTSVDSTRSEETAVTSVSRKWSQIRNVLSFKSAVVTPPQNTSPPKTPPRIRASSVSSNNSPVREAGPPEKMATFKFSLEWIERPIFGRERILGPTRLAAPTHKYLESLTEDGLVVDVEGLVMDRRHLTYVGRALAEWVLVIIEYENFFERRKMEGRETDKAVETPTLGVDSLRKF
ncbi:hypothetical protein EDC01DRAFT_165523 [Geopyxis carbonaria]|nr:hypothetical protein EDC01DRAFT_165523 [Geopyxis carbonaria]